MTSDVNELKSKIQKYESYIQHDPENTLLWISIGDLYHASGQLDKATACFEKTLLIDGENTIARARLGNVLLSQHQFSEAEKLYISALSDEQDPTLQHNLGLSLFYQKKWSEALHAFESSSANGIADPQNTEYLVYALHHMDKTEEALALGQQWLDLAPGPRTEGYISMLEMDHGDMGAATERANRVIEEDPENADANTVLGTFKMEQQEVAKARAHFERVVGRESDSPRGWQGLGLTYMYEQNFDRAMECFLRAQSFMPDNATNSLIMGWLELARTKPVEAEMYFRRSIELDRNFGEAHGGLAAALILQNKKEEAKEEIKRSQGLDPEGFGAVYAASILMQLEGRGALGTKLMARLFERTPPHGDKPLIDYIQVFLKQQSAAEKAANRKNALPKKKR